MRGCVFMDRDGVINRNPPAGDYILNWSEFTFMPRIEDWIQIFNALGLLVIVVTNQRCVARGLMTGQALDELHRRMAAELLSRGARVDDVLTCPHEDGVCNCRKPLPGLIRQAVDKWNIDLSRSILIGDTDRDRELAANCGIPFVLVKDGAVMETVHSSLCLER